MEKSFAFTALIFLGAAIVMVPLVRKWGLSSVIGYILGGIIIGPFVLQLTGSDTENIMHATEFGVVMLLFLVGLELEPKKFWSLRRKILGLGISQMVFTILLLTPIFVFFSWPFSKSITLAMCFAMSSTAIVLQLLSEKNLFKTSAGEASFATLLFQDIAVIPILAVLPLIAKKEIQENSEMQMLLQALPEWLQTASIFAAVGILILLARFIFVPFLRYVSRSGMPELLTASSLFLVIGVSELMIAAGISPALGAFLAGVMLANTEFRHELESQIEPFKGLLLAVFFVSVGATLNFDIIAQNPLLIFVLVIVVMAVKFLVLFLIGKFFKIEITQNYFYAVALSQVGEFSFVLLNYAGKLNLLDETLLSQMMSVTAITMCITPILLLIHDHIISKKFNKRIAEDQDFDIEKENITFKKIIIVGFGHFGSTVGRLLKANQVSATVLDNDSARVKLLRSYGFKVYYGDATRFQVLESAGLKDAKILALCLDDPEDNKYIAELVREKYPEIKIFVRAKNRNDAYYYINHGIENIYRETLGTAVNMAVDLLHHNGMRKYAARRIAKRFTLIDKASVRRLADMDENDTSFTVKDSILREQELLAYDNMNFESHDFVEDEEDSLEDQIIL